MSNTQIFISYKFHGSEGEILPDYYMAKELYEKLSALGLNVFFSDETIRRTGQSDYKHTIDTRLDEAEMLIVVSTHPDHCNSNWVRYEWDSFYNDILSEQKQGQLISYLDTDDVRKFPRTIRTLQVFEKKNGTDDLVNFVRSYFKIPEKATPDASGFKGSSYNYDAVYELGDERRRLAIQGKVESRNDHGYIAEFLPVDDHVCTVLDVGCSTGSVTRDVFSPFGERVRLLGIDKFAHCVEGFNASAPGNMSAAQLNFDDDDWEPALSKIMCEKGIDGFDLVYCALSLHHMADSAGVIKKLWKYIKHGGHVFIRTCDDALKIAYPNEEPIYEIIKKTASVPRVSDRFHGRKAHSILYKAKFKNIELRSFLIDTAGKDISERYAMFYSTFVWRKNYFKNQLEIAKTPEEIDYALSEYNKVNELIDSIEELFSDNAFYFGYYVTVAIAEKIDPLCGFMD